MGDCARMGLLFAAKGEGQEQASYDEEAEVQDGAVEGGEMEEREGGRSKIEERGIEER